MSLIAFTAFGVCLVFSVVLCVIIYTNPVHLDVYICLFPPFSSSVKATEKREGGGAHNWGKAEDVELKYVCM